MPRRQKEKLTKAERETRVIEQDYYGPEGVEDVLQRTEGGSTRERVVMVWNWVYLGVAAVSLMVFITSVWIAFNPDTKPADKNIMRGLFIGQCVATLVAVIAFVRAMWWPTEAFAGAQERWHVFLMRMNAFFTFLVASITLVVILLVSLAIKDKLNIFVG